MLKAVYDKLDDIPEALRTYYTERNGKWEIKVEGMKTQADVDRVQGALDKEKKDHVTTKTAAKVAADKLVEFADLDPHDVTEKLAKLATLEAANPGGTPDQTKIDTLVAQRVEAGVKQKTAVSDRKIVDLTAKLAESDGKVTELSGNINGRTIDDAIREAATVAKVAPDAVKDLLIIARSNFQLSDDGKTVVSKDGLDPKTWVTDQKATRPYFWTPAQGAGAQGQNGTVDGKVNPFSREHFNVTEQGKLVTADRAAAERLATAAGTTIGGGMPAAPPAKAAA